ncbi:MAG TPA: 50S ribosomal protein L15 [Gemmatales bacterium]|nr:50S ribosomal protein L15 [Gemmatales bacterium]HMP60052.1 50S ribosomal protein L15 [Gemmatales bacterium]
MDLTTVHQGVHKLRKKRRPGRGIGSGMGKTATRGYKGQMSRSGAKTPISLHEGGQIPLVRRIPKRGFNNNTWRRFYAVVNVGDVDRLFDAGAHIDEAALRAKKLVKGVADGVRILGTGEVTKKFSFRVHHVSASAKQKIEAKGGTIELVPPPKKPVQNKMKPRPPKNPA